MTCAKAERWISLELDGRLGPVRRALLRRHVERCDACAAYRGEAAAVDRAARAAAPVRMPDVLRAGFETRLRAGLDEIAARRSAPAAAPAPVRRPLPAWAWAGAAAGVFALAGAAIFLRSSAGPALPGYFGDPMTALYTAIDETPSLGNDFEAAIDDPADDAVAPDPDGAAASLDAGPLFWAGLTDEDLTAIEADLRAGTGSR